jgi:hypothetical protein
MLLLLLLLARRLAVCCGDQESKCIHTEDRLPAATRTALQ